MSEDNVESKDISQKNDDNKPPNIIEKISKNNNIPLEDFLNDNDAISLIKSEEKILKRYFNPERIKQLIKYITKEPKDNSYLIGYKYPYISYEILKSNCNYISKRFILNEEEYYKEFYYLDDILERMNLSIQKLKGRVEQSASVSDTNNEIKENKIEEKADINNSKEINKDNNEYLDLLLEIVMEDKIELNSVLSGYFSEVMKILLDKYPYQIYKYLYTKKKDEIKKILFRSYQKSFAEISEKLLNLESVRNTFFLVDKNVVEDLIKDNIKYRNNIIKEVLNSINLKGLKFENEYITDIDNILSLIVGLIDKKTNIMSIFESNLLSSHIGNILNTNLYDDSEENKNNFNERYNIYCLFIKFISEIVNILNNKYKYNPSKEDFERVKNKKCEQFRDFLVDSLENIIKNNFRPKSDSKKEVLGILNVHIVDLLKKMFKFMSKLPKEFDEILINNNFCEKSIEYFFKYQWNNIYHNKFFEFFCYYLKNEKYHTDITDCFFRKIKLQNLLCDFLENKETESDIYLPKIKHELKSGNKTKSGIFGHVIFLVYKIQFYSGLETFSEEEIQSMNIRHLGEFKFLKVTQYYIFQSKKNEEKSQNLKNILSEDKKWCEMFRNIAFPIIKRYEIQLFKKEFNRMINKKREEEKKSKNKNNDNISEINNNKDNNDKSSNINNNDETHNNKDDNSNKTNKENLSSNNLKDKNAPYNNNDLTKNTENIDKIINNEKKRKNTNNISANVSDAMDNNNYFNDANYWKINIILDNNIFCKDEEEYELIKIASSLENKQKNVINNIKNDIDNQYIDNKNNKEGNNNKNRNEYKKNENKINNINIVKDKMEINIQEKEEKVDLNKNINLNDDENEIAYNDINYWKIIPSTYFNEKELEDILNII